MTMPSEEEVRSMFQTHPEHGKTIRMVPADIAEELARALEAIRELNMTGTDENGQQWANSDIIDQTVTLALARYRAITN